MLILSLAFCSSIYAQSKIPQKKIAKLKRIDSQSKERLSKRLELYAEYLQNNEHEKLFGLIINNFESKMMLPFQEIYFEKGSQGEEFRTKFFELMEQFDDFEKPERLGVIIDYRITNVMWKSEIKGADVEEAEDALYISMDFKRHSKNPYHRNPIYWNKGYWFYAFYDDNDWYFTPFSWVEI